MPGAVQKRWLGMPWSLRAYTDNSGGPRVMNLKICFSN
jgi:hypothetical protein